MRNHRNLQCSSFSAERVIVSGRIAPRSYLRQNAVTRISLVKEEKRSSSSLLSMWSTMEVHAWRFSITSKLVRLSDGQTSRKENSNHDRLGNILEVDLLEIATFFISLIAPKLLSDVVGLSKSTWEAADLDASMHSDAGACDVLPGNINIDCSMGKLPLNGYGRGNWSKPSSSLFVHAVAQPKGPRTCCMIAMNETSCTADTEVFWSHQSRCHSGYRCVCF